MQLLGSRGGLKGERSGRRGQKRGAVAVEKSEAAPDVAEGNGGPPPGHKLINLFLRLGVFVERHRYIGDGSVSARRPRAAMRTWGSDSR